MKTKSVIISVLAILFSTVCGINTTYAGPTAAITLTATPLSVPADGVSSIAITAKLLDSANFPVDIGTKVTFTTTLGNFRDPTTFILQKAITETVVAENNTWPETRVVVSLMSEKTSGIALISCTSNGVTQYVTVSFDATGSIKLTAIPPWIPSDGKSSSGIKATVINTGGIAVAVGTPVTFTTTKGLLSNGKDSPAKTITVQVSNAEGTVSVSLIAATDPGIAEVTCTSSEMTQTVTVAMGVGSIALTASPTSLPADGHSSSAIEAVVNNSAGLPVSVGTSVTFSTQLGTFSNGQQTITMGTIDSTGVVTVSLIAGTTSGLAEVVCSSGGLTQSVSVSIGTLPIASITLAANPGSIPADGASSSTITATVLDVSGNPLNKDSVPVTFTTNLGHFSNGSKTITVSTIKVLIDPGKVVVSLIAGTTPGVALVVCESGQVTQSTNVTIGSSAEVASITLTANPTSLPADGASSTTLTATVLDISGNPLNKDNILVKFTTTLGHFSNGTNTITVATMWVDTHTTRKPGMVLVSLIAGTISGIAQVICESGNVTQSIIVTIGTSGQVASIKLSANPASLPADGASSSTLTAELLDTSGNLINLSNIPVTFTTTLGHFANNLQTITVTSQSTTAVPGKVVVSLIAGTTSGIALIKCESGGVTQTTNVTIGTSGQVASITLSASPTSLPADGASSSTLTAELLDTSGNLINLSSIPVTFTTTLGHFSNNLQTITVTSQSTTAVPGKVVVSLIAGTTSGIALIKCESGGVTQTTNVMIGSSAQVASITLSASPTSLPADGISSSTITAFLKDVTGSPITQSDIAVTFTTTLGHFSNGSNTITVITANSIFFSGEVVVSLIAGTTSGIALIKCESGGVTQITNVTIGTSGQVASITLSASPTSLPADGASSSTLTAQLLDTSGNLINLSSIPVTFTTTLGHFSNNLQTITVTSQSTMAVPGKVVVSLIAGTTSGIALIKCESGGVTQVTNVTIGSSAQVASIMLSASPTTLPADGMSSSTITALLKDITGSPVTQSNISVTFTTTQDLGHFSNGSNTLTVTTANSGGSPGAVVVSLIAGTSSGTAVITCASGGVTQATTITIGSVSTQVASITLTASPSSFPASDATLSSTITATLYTANGQPVSSGVLVSFATNLGFFSSKQKPEIGYTNPSGVAVAYVYSGGAAGTAEINVSAGGINRYVYVNFTGTGVGPPAFISLSAAHNWIPADGYSYTAITAVILDSAAQPVAAGTVVKFTTTSLGVFENGKTTYLTATPDAKGTLTVYLRSASTIDITEAAMITCSSGSIMQSITVDIVRLEYETEPNNDMLQADGICFSNVFLGQLSSPYEEDWYTFTITESSRIGINFITTAAPADAKCDSGTTTVGTWKVDIRDSNNNVLMSYHNVDCTFDNGIWETGVVPRGTYYVVVYCPKLGGTGDIYLSDPYYMRVFNDFYFPCVDRDQSVNSATMSQKSSAYQLHLPIIDPVPYLWADFQYDPIPSTSLMFKLTNYGVLTNLEGYRACNLSTLSLVDGNYVLHIPLLIFDGVSYRADLIYVPTTDGLIWFMLSGFWAN